jgi:hypothetical protein
MMEEQFDDGMALQSAGEMILNLAIGGPWAEQKGIDDAAMPQRMKVDYVRMWQVQPRRRP